MPAISRKSFPQISILLLLWLAAFYPIAPEMVNTWFNHSDNSHAMLVPIIVLYLIWLKREELSRIEISGSIWGGLLLFISLALYLISFAGGIAVASRLMMVASLTGLVWCCLGRKMMRAMIFPLAFLFFMVPIPDTVIGAVSFPLQLTATKMSTALIQLCGIPVYREGNMLHLANTQLEVAEACSGIRSIVSLAMLSILLAYLVQRGWWRKLVLIASAIPVAMIANVARVTATGILAYFYGDHVARGFLHEFSGMVVFVFGMGVLFLESHLLNRIHQNPSKPHLPSESDRTQSDDRP